MIGAVAFDIGKVLLDFDYTILTRRMALQSEWDEAKLDAYLNQSPFLAKYESGLLSSTEFYKLIRNETGFMGAEADFAALFGDIFTPISQMIDIHKQIASSGVPTYTFSNTNEMAVRNISKNYDFWLLFNGHILSHEVGALKPKPEIYEALEDIAGLSGEAIAYVDDLHVNCAAGGKRGWKVCCHKDANSSREFFRELGLLSPS